jgi:hypothetical protein
MDCSSRRQRRVSCFSNIGPPGQPHTSACYRYRCASASLDVIGVINQVQPASKSLARRLARARGGPAGETAHERADGRCLRRFRSGNWAMDGRPRRRRRKASVPRHVPRGQPALDSVAQLQHGVGGRGRACVAEERGLFAAVRQGARAGAAGRARRARRQAADVPPVPLLLRAQLRRSFTLADVF